jgi:hypothetical protein
MASEEQIEQLTDTWRGIVGMAESDDAKAIVMAMSILTTELRAFRDEYTRLNRPTGFTARPKA